MDQAHRKRNRFEYEGVLDVDTALAEALIRASQVEADRVEALGSVPTD